MSRSSQRADWPLWVRFGLWGLPGRRVARMCVWLSIAIALASVSFGLRDRRFFVGTILVLAALWYEAAIRWVDRHGRWEPETS